VRDGRLGLEIAQRLFEDKKDLRVRETLALAYAEAGRFGEAAALQRGLVAEAERSGRTALAEDLRAELDAFERREAWWASSPDEILTATLGAPPGS
jgi:cytochrome c-type biogenesis protein CcmH/NrfG